MVYIYNRTNSEYTTFKHFTNNIYSRLNSTPDGTRSHLIDDCLGVNEFNLIWPLLYQCISIDFQELAAQPSWSWVFSLA